jgi:hypothetical protein
MSDNLKNSRVVVAPETYNLVSLAQEEWKELLANPEASPRMTTPFLIFFDNFEVTMLLDDADLASIRTHSSGAKVERGFRLITFDIVLGFLVVGFLAEVSQILAQAEVPIVALSAFSRDHILVKQADLANALLALSGHVAELC